ncbi:DNA excision repair protein ERCC-6 [Pancytospora epiphaga]|nr:DNA excision repair protein ERCC-6 [Pancytospora epiphaga]
MKQAADANDYETNFLERFFKSQSEKKISDLNLKLQATTDPLKIREYKKCIASLEAELTAKLDLITETECERQEPTTNLVPSIGRDDGSVINVVGIDIPRCQWDYLFDYQKEGVKWMIDLYLKGKGGILADEMGLGKTIQTVVAIVGILKSEKAKKVLILCPATLVEQWIDEFRKVSTDIKIVRKLKQLDGEVAVMSYEMFKSENKWEKFDIFILDEGHKIKNRDAQITKIVKAVKSKSKFILTGTPIQNNLGEMWSLFDFVVPGILGTYVTFQDEFEVPIKQRRCSETSYRYSMHLRSIIEPYLLRRLKKQFSNQLPGKLDKVVFVMLTEHQHQLYIKALESDYLRKALSEKNKLLAAIDMLRKICNHPLLAKSCKYIDSRQWDENGKFNREILQNEDESQDINSESFDYDPLCNDSIVSASCKMQVLMKLLSEWHGEKRKVLVFCQTTQMQRLIEKAVRLAQYKYLSMSGKTPVSKRNSLVNSFNNTPSIFIFILTTRVGGFGLNLTGANRVVLFDPDWNPATDAQAKERIYRYGQKSDVEIYRIVCKDTIEEKIYQRQIYKNCLSRKILTNPSISIDRSIAIDLFSYETNRETGGEASIASVGVDQVDTDVLLVNVREEDKKEFSLMKELQSKTRLSGLELVDFIERREMSLENT